MTTPNFDHVLKLMMLSEISGKNGARGVLRRVEELKHKFIYVPRWDVQLLATVRKCAQKTLSFILKETINFVPV